jgi:CheY-like chemotaxis protein
VPNRYLRTMSWCSPFGVLGHIAARGRRGADIDATNWLGDEGVIPSAPVFLVEDDLLVQSLLQEALEKAGYDVAVASTGEDAIVLLDQAGEELGALITDVELLPDKLTGWDVGRHARRLFPKLPVIYITGARGHDWPGEGVPRSILLEKPFASSSFLMVVAQLVAIGSLGEGGPGLVR